MLNRQAGSASREELGQSGSSLLALGLEARPSGTAAPTGSVWLGAHPRAAGASTSRYHTSSCQSIFTSLHSG